ncbi:MAG: DegV family protein [Firmicutes bacterium]|nr:DegV family protein [Bacillota bacterium]
MRIFTDTNCEIDFEEFNDLGVELIKMPYTLDGQMSYYDLGENTNLSDFYAAMEKGAVAKTQALNEHDYIEYFEPVLKNGEDILYISFSHTMSGTFNSMNMAIASLKEKYPDRTITCIDSGQISIGGGILVKEVIKNYRQGMSLSEIPRLVERLRGKIMIYVTVGDLEYLRRGGRISRMKSMVGSILGFKPIIYMDGVRGMLDSAGKVKGRKAAIKHIIGIVEASELEEGSELVILYAGCLEDAEIIKENLLEKYNNNPIKMHEVGPVVGAHCGPGTVGIVFIKK